MDADPFSNPSSAVNSPFDNGGDPEGPDLEDKVRELLSGKLDDADISALLELIMGTGAAPPAPPLQPAQDRRRSLAHDQRMPSQSTMRRLVAESMQASGRDQHRKLVERFPALKGARVV